MVDVVIRIDLIKRAAKDDFAGLGIARGRAGADGAGSRAFFGKYLEVSPPSRLVWTNDEGDEGAVTTVTFEERDGNTLLVLQELYPSKEALDASFVGMEDGYPEQFEQLDELLITLSASA